MRLGQLINSLGSYQVFSKEKDFSKLIDSDIKGISCDSRKVSPGFIFVAIQGALRDGHSFIQEAIDRGAEAVIAKNPESAGELKTTQDVLVVGVEDTRKALAALAAEFYAHPSRDIKVIGITGTNGKTTVSYLIEALLKESQRNSAVIGTINYRFNHKVIPAKNTTPGPLELQSLLHEMLAQGVRYAVTEVSSHALDQERVGGIDFHAAVFTNLTHDHLDYHRNLDNYFQAKSKLFQNIPSSASAIINHDDAYGRRLLGLTPAKITTYGIQYNVDVLAKNIRFDFRHTEFTLQAARQELEIKTSLIGRHNVYNLLAAIAFGLNEGLGLPSIKSAIEKFGFVPGRLERIDTEKGFYCFVDYAHTEDALRNVISTLREISNKRIIVVFGCGGERDKTKRPKMGAVVTALADYAIITSDNPRSEDPQEIINDIKAGVTKDNYCVVLERKEALKKSLSLVKPGDCLLVAGKGHEDYQVLKDKTIAFSDREVIRECLK